MWGKHRRSTTKYGLTVASRRLANTLPQSRSRLSEAAGENGFTLKIGRSLPAAGSGTNRSAGSRRVGLARGRSGTISASRRLLWLPRSQLPPRSRKGFRVFHFSQRDL